MYVSTKTRAGDSDPILAFAHCFYHYTYPDASQFRNLDTAGHKVSGDAADARRPMRFQPA
jgi:hypothetical protein